MKTQFDRLRQTWSQLGAEDPFWAVVSQMNKRNGKWDVESFLATGQANVRDYHQLLSSKAGAPERFSSVLDFGCGVGRLSIAWSPRADKVVGVDISQPMIAQAKRLASKLNNVEFQENHEEHLACFPSGQFELVCSHICLQHMPWSLAQKYILEFGRVCEPGGWVAFQLPSRPLLQSQQRNSRLKKWLIDSLPFGLGGIYRRHKHGTDAVFDMHFTMPDEVVEAAGKAGLSECHRESDQAAGPGAESYIYVFKKPSLEAHK